MIKIETDRLILREYVQADWEQLQAYCADPEVTRYLTWGPNTPEQTKAFIVRAMEWRNEAPRMTFELAVVLKATGKLVGGIGLRIKSQVRKEADLGYCYSKDVWGQGIGTEAARALLKFGFEQLGLHRIYATCDTANQGSAGIMRKNGMTREAHFRQDQLIKGVWRDTWLYAILEDEWQRRSHEAPIMMSVT